MNCVGTWGIGQTVKISACHAAWGQFNSGIPRNILVQVSVHKFAILCRHSVARREEGEIPSWTTMWRRP